MNFGTKVACSFIKEALQNQAIQAIQKQANQKTKNIIVSPLNFDGLIRMVVHGIAGGQLKDMIDRQFQSFGSDPFPDVFNNLNLKVNNHIFMDESLPINSWYKQLMEDKYRAMVHRVDFKQFDQLDSIEKYINDHASNDTLGLIGKIIGKKDIFTQLRVVALNSLYYKGSWLNPFTPFPDPIDFLTVRGKIVKPSFMYCSTFSHSRFQGFDLIKIPYQDDVSMYIFQPDTLSVLIRKILDDRSNSFLCQDFNLEKSEPFDSLWLPKFQVKYKTKKLISIADKVLHSLLVDLDQRAISDKGHLRVWKVAHECSVNVDEKGTEAAACTLKVLETCGWPRKEIVVDKPFLFMIRHDVSNMILFLGMVLNPME